MSERASYASVQSALESRLLLQASAPAAVRQQHTLRSSISPSPTPTQCPPTRAGGSRQQGRRDHWRRRCCQLCYCLPSLSPLMSAALSKPAYSVGMCRIWRVSRPCRVLAPPSSACILDTDSPVGLLANSCECSEPYRWVAAVTTCSCRAAHKAAPPAIIITVPVVSSLAELQSSHHPNTY